VLIETEVPEPIFVPPQEPEYHCQLVASFKFPVATVKFVDPPAQNEVVPLKVGTSGSLQGVDGVKQISTPQVAKDPPSWLKLSVIDNVQVPFIASPSNALKTEEGWYVPPPVGGQGNAPAAASSSKFKSKSFSDEQI